MRANLPLLLVAGCVMGSSHADDPSCRISAGEVVGIRDPRLHEPGCYIEAGVTIRLYVEEVETRVARARIERHAACSPREDEQKLMDDLTQKARDYLTERGAIETSIEVVEAACAPKRGVDLVIVEVK